MRTLGPIPLVLILTLAAVPSAAVDFPPVTDRERAMDAAPGFPEAPAVVLYRNGHFTMMGSLGSEAYSSLVVEGRVKLLTEDGTDHGEVQVPHSDFVRLVSFDGRTVLPDGSVVPLPEDSLFEQTVTGQKRWSLTTATFPALEAGAILDYRYELRFETVRSFDPWYFQDHIPTLHSEIVYTVPGNVAAQPWGKATFGRSFQSEREKTARGMRLKVWMEDLPPVPDEPYTLPFEDLSSSFLLLPTMMEIGGDRFLLFEDWRSACDIADYTYGEVRRRDGAARRQAKKLAKEAGRDPDARARAIYAFVRDEIGTLHLPGVVPVLGEAVDEMLRERRADVAGKGIMLREMLDAAGLDAELVWAADRDYGIIDTSLANINWFEKVLVRVGLDGSHVYLDPSDSAAAFGYIGWELEGMEGVVYSTRKPEVITLPQAPFDANLRHAVLDLAVGEDGTVSGIGTMAYEGHAAARLLRLGTSEALVEWMAEYLGEQLPGFEVTDLEITEDRDAPRLELSWSLDQWEEEVLGDQAALVPSRPLGPVPQRFELAPIERLTPVLLSFADRDVVDVTVTWPEGWAPEVVPAATSHGSPAGEYVLEVELDEETRTLRYSRRFDTHRKDFTGNEQYTALRNLYRAVEKGDAQELVLVAR